MEFDPAALRLSEGRSSCSASLAGLSVTATLVAALIEHVMDTARHLGVGCIGQRLVPPVALVFDEAANYASFPAVAHERGRRLGHHDAGGAADSCHY